MSKEVCSSEQTGDFSINEKEISLCPESKSPVGDKNFRLKDVSTSSWDFSYPSLSIF